MARSLLLQATSADTTEAIGDRNKRIVGYTSVRRCPRRDAISKIEPVYRQMLAAEHAAGARDAIAAGTKVLLDLLQQTGMSAKNWSFPFRRWLSLSCSGPVLAPPCLALAGRAFLGSGTSRLVLAGKHCHRALARTRPVAQPGRSGDLVARMPQALQDRRLEAIRVNLNSLLDQTENGFPGNSRCDVGLVRKP